MAEITREIVQDLLIPEQVVGRLQARRITIPAGAVTGPHTHNGPVFGVVLAGTALVQIDGGEPTRDRVLNRRHVIDPVTSRWVNSQKNNVLVTRHRYLTVIHF